MSDIILFLINQSNIFQLNVNNLNMKLPKSRQYGANIDDKETFAPKQFEIDKKFDENKRK